MLIKVGTFNLNNLFSRFNFDGAIDAIQQGGGAEAALTIQYEFTDPTTIRVRTFLGKLVMAKAADETAAIAQRILAMDLGVLAVQEVEDVDILRQFNRDELGSLYPFQVLIEGNDPRFIDVGVLSKLPIGAVTSFQTVVHEDVPAEPVFSRDLLEAEIWNSDRTERLFTLYTTHLKSQFVPFPQDPVQGKKDADARRERQAQMISKLVSSRQRPTSRFMIAGDMNDTPTAEILAPMLTVDGQSLVNALESPQETRPPKAEMFGPGPQTTAWTHRFPQTAQSPLFELFDQIWLSPTLGDRPFNAFVRPPLPTTGTDE